MEFRQLKYFIGVAEELHFGNAAKKLFVSQSALSQQIQLLEQEIGAELFVKSKRNYQHKVELTEAGTSFLNDAYKIMQLAQQSVINARKAYKENTAIRLGYFNLIPMSAVMYILRLFKELYPNISINLIGMPSPKVVEESLYNESIDVGIVLMPLKTRNLTTHTFICSQTCVAVHSSEALAQHDVIPIHFLEHEQWIDLAKSIHPIYEKVENVFRNNGIKRTIAQEVSSFEWVFALVEQKMGIGLVPDGILNPAGQQVVCRPLVDNNSLPIPELEVCIALAHRNNYEISRIEMVIEELNKRIW